MKALSDWVVTSGNAEDVVRTGCRRSYEILFVPDKHLGRYLQEVTGRRDDPVGRLVHGPRDLQRPRPVEAEEAASARDDDRPPGVPARTSCEHTDFVGGTEAMIKHVGTYKEPTDFLVATEANMMWQLQRQVPAAPLPRRCRASRCACNKCPHMARNTLEKVRDCMKYGEPEITWQPEFDKAREVLERSLLQPPTKVVSKEGHPAGD